MTWEIQLIYVQYKFALAFFKYTYLSPRFKWHNSCFGIKIYKFIQKVNKTLKKEAQKHCN